MTKSKNKKSKAYWEKRSEQQLLDLLDQADEVKDKLERYYSKAIRYINRDIKTLFGRYMTDNGIDTDKAMGLLSGNDYKEWRFTMEEYLQQIEATGNKALLLELNTLTMRKRITRLLALRAGILAISAILAQIEDEQVGDFLEKGLTDTYYRAIYDEYRDENPEAIELTESHHVKPSKDNIKAILTNPWSGSNYSENIWTNSYLIAKRAEQAITKNIIAGKSINNLTNELERVYGNKYRANIKRLLRTETAYIKGQGDILAYKKLKVEEYEILATLDNRTSSICRSKDGKHYPIDEATVGENYPPFHPNCRTTTIKYISDEKKRAKRTRLARDKNGKNVKVPLDMKYEERLKWVEDPEERNKIIF